MTLECLGARITRRHRDVGLGYLFVCVVAFCFDFVYISPLFYEVIGYHVDVNCGGLGLFLKMQGSSLIHVCLFLTVSSYFADEILYCLQV